MANYEQYGIKVPYGTTGNIKTTCPACTPHNRKPANRNAKDLSVNTVEEVFNCHNCGWSGSLKEKREREMKSYSKPVIIDLPMSDKSISWFAQRKISERTLKAFNVSEKYEYMPQVQKESNCICFPYIKNGEWVNIKFRDGLKNFKMTKDAELCIFNYDAVKGKKTVVITEGEIDCMSVFESGYCLLDSTAVCSVPNGATKGNQNLAYLDNSWEAFNECESIIIATDNDAAGIALKNELSRRLGKYRCREIIYPEGCKDFNEVLISHGETGVISCLKNSISFPLDGIHTLLDFNNQLDYLYENGFQQGVKIGYPEFDKLLNFSDGQLTMVTGVPNSGKSAFIDQILIRLASRHNWNIGVCSFEKQPEVKHISDLLGCYVGKPFYRKDAYEKMSAEDYSKAKNFLHSHFFWFKMKDEDLSVDGIISRAIHLVKSKGIKALLIDPYNYMEHKRPAGQSETEYISELLSKICTFAIDYGVHVFLVAHPTKIKKAANGDFEVPNLYDISGSANFFNKTSNGITVYRDRATNMVWVYIQKVRFFINGKLGHACFMFDPNTGRYKEENAPDFERELLYRDGVSQFDKPYAGFRQPGTNFYDNPL